MCVCVCVCIYIYVFDFEVELLTVSPYNVLLTYNNLAEISTVKGKTVD